MRKQCYVGSYVTQIRSSWCISGPRTSTTTLGLSGLYRGLCVANPCGDRRQKDGGWRPARKQAEKPKPRANLTGLSTEYLVDGQVKLEAAAAGWDCRSLITGGVGRVGVLWEGRA
jgi:hypothetical protein